MHLNLEVLHKQGIMHLQEPLQQQLKVNYNQNPVREWGIVIKWIILFSMIETCYK